jgi:hypothetical protein
MNTSNITQNLATIEEKRKFLRKLSDSVSSLVEAGEFNNINEAVIDTFYKDGDHTQFKTFNDWKTEGYSIIKGSKAFLVWGKPKRVQDSEKAKEQGKDEPTEDRERDFFPLAFLFSNAQVEVKKGEKRNA